MENKDFAGKPENDGGLYKNVNVPIRTLNICILVLLAVLVGAILFGSMSDGYHVTYDSKGGSDVEYQTYQYQQELVLPDEPSREGYTFSGWYLDPDGVQQAADGMPVESDTTLYALWEKQN
jgi:uncharacterized repeat protein (TIGR02543 family)